MKQLLSHPLFQVFSFSIILVGSPSFGGPYLLFVVMATTQGGLSGIVGTIGIIVTLSSSYVPWKRPVQFVGLLFMILSLALNFYQVPLENVHETFAHFWPVVTVVLFVIVSVTVIIKTFYYPFDDFKKD